MSETSSFAKSSCDWTFISNEPPDIETLGSEAAEDFLARLLESLPVRETELQEALDSTSAVVPLLRPAVTISSSSQDAVGPSGFAGVRKRRLRKNSSTVLTDLEEETLESALSEDGEEKEDEKQQEEVQAGVKPAAGLGVQGVQGVQGAQGVQGVQGGRSSIRNRCILVALMMAIIVGFGFLHGSVEIPDRQKIMEKTPVNKLDGVRDLLQPLMDQMGDVALDDLDEQTIISLLTEVTEKMKKENQELRCQQTHIKAQRDDLMADNQILRGALEREEKYLSTLPEELRNVCWEFFFLFSFLFVLFFLACPVQHPRQAV